MKSYPANLCILTPRTFLGGAGDPEALENVIVDELPDGALCWVLNAAQNYYLDKFSMTAVNNPEVIATIRGAAAPGRWKRSHTTIEVTGAGLTTPVFTDQLIVSPGITATSNGVRFYYGNQNTLDVALTTNNSTPVLAAVLTGLGANRKLNATLGVRVVIWDAATKQNSGSIDIVVDLYITTDGAGVATISLQTVPFPDTSRLPPAMSTSTATVANSVGGFTISATRPAGVASDARAKWWVTAFEDIT